MGGLVKFASYASAVIGGGLLVLGVIRLIDADPATAMMLAPLGGLFLGAGIVGGVKINS